MSDLTAEYLLRQAAEGRPVTDEMVAEVGLPADADQLVVDGLNTINAIRASGGYGALPFALAVADETASRVEEMTAKPPRVRQPAAAATAADPEVERAVGRITAERFLHHGVAR